MNDQFRVRRMTGDSDDLLRRTTDYRQHSLTVLTNTDDNPLIRQIESSSNLGEDEEYSPYKVSTRSPIKSMSRDRITSNDYD